MQRLSGFSVGKLTALFTLVGVAITLSFGGQEILSPGPLSAQSRTRVVLGGVSSHAQLKGNCSACHVPPWSSETMADRCLNCHVNVRQQLAAGQPLHGMLANGMTCRECHTEHKGSHAALTDFSSFDHDCTAFKLTGQHRGVDCASCHPNRRYKGTSHHCASCHPEPDVHRGKFGTDCARCHTTAGWEDITFVHSFPVNHANALKKGEGCAICHSKSEDYRVYTCSNCHKHDLVKTQEKHAKRGIFNVQDCASCHPQGRKQGPAKPRVVASDSACPEAGRFCQEPHRERLAAGSREGLALIQNALLNGEGSYPRKGEPLGTAKATPFMARTPPFSLDGELFENLRRLR